MEGKPNTKKLGCGKKKIIREDYAIKMRIKVRGFEGKRGQLYNKRGENQNKMWQKKKKRIQLK